MNLAAMTSQPADRTVLDFLTRVAPERDQWIERNRYYYRSLYQLIRNRIPFPTSVCHIGCDTTQLLEALQPDRGVGLCLTSVQKEFCEAKDKKNVYDTFEALSSFQEKFDYVVITSLGHFSDIQEILEQIKILCHPHTKILIANYNFLWEPVFHLGEKIGLRMPQPPLRQNMVPTHHILNLLPLSDYDIVQGSCHLLMPIYIPLLSWFANTMLASVFPFRFLSSTDIVVARPRLKPSRPLTCSVIVPCKNEEGTIETIAERLPELADRTELILIDDQSTDKTFDRMQGCLKRFPQKNIKVLKGPGVSKGEAVRTGALAAEGEILAILDADLAVPPEELPKCIKPLLDGNADFVNTIRFVYPQEQKAMRWLNAAGNRLFALFFTFLLRQRVSDTLSGTKVFWKKDYEKISDMKGFWVWRDRWGDFEQLLGASKLGLKIVDIPIHYQARVHGETKMGRRFSNGWHMLKICAAALFKLRLS